MSLAVMLAADAVELSSAIPCPILPAAVPGGLTQKPATRRSACRASIAGPLRVCRRARFLMTTVAVVYAVIPAAPVSCDTRGSSSGSRGTLRANAESSPSSVTRRVSATVSEYGATPLRTRTVSSTSAALTPSRILAYGRLRVPKLGPATVVLSTTTQVGFNTTSVTVSATPPARPITNALPTVTAAALLDDQVIG